MDQTLHRVATKEREEIKGTTKQKMARRHNREGGNHLDKEGNRQTTMEDIDGGLHPAVDGQSLDKNEDDEEVIYRSCFELFSITVFDTGIRCTLYKRNNLF